MALRFLLPGILWVGFMILVFVTPVDTSLSKFFGVIPPRACIHGFLYFGFTHIFLGIVNKQRNYASIKRNSILVVLICAMVVIAISETILAQHPIQYSNPIWNIIFDFAGSFLGIGTFHLLYKGCC